MVELNVKSQRKRDQKVGYMLRLLMSQGRPTGRMDEDYLDSILYGEEDDVVAPLIGTAWDAYIEAHQYRKSKKFVAVITAAFWEYLTATKLHENMSLRVITKDTGRKWLAYMATPRQFPARAIAKAVTMDRKIGYVRHFLGWAVKEDLLVSNPFEGLTINPRTVSASRVRKEGFTEAELSVIFNALSPYRTSADPARVQFYYVARLLAVTGARCMEVLQLNVSDVQEIEGHWCIVCRDGEGKAHKNRTSLRTIPLHSSVLPVFLSWFHQQKGPQLFPLLHVQGSQIVSRYFSELLKRTGIKRPEVSLHSLRHTVTQKLARARTFPPLQNRLLGHSIGKSVEEKVYMASLEFTVQELHAAIAACSFPTMS